MEVFISHSSKDGHVATKISQELSRFGIHAWAYEQEIASGEDIVFNVETALKRVDYVLVLFSEAAIQSNWLKREVASRLIDDLAGGKESIIPVLLDEVPVPYLLKAVKWVDLRASFSVGIAQILGRLHGTSQDVARFQQMFEMMYLLLLLDQFPNGVWGASLEQSADLYGHKDDPGSISISTFSTFAITRFTGSRTAEAIQAYRKYLLSRQSGRGAFGMKRSPGTSKYPKSEVLEHARHTATGLSFFLFYDGYGDKRVSDALNYLLGTRTQSGLWVDFGPVTDTEVDPITVAFVIDALEQTHDAITRTASMGKDDEHLLKQLDSCITVGLDYVFNCPLRTPEGFWYYKYSSMDDKARVLQNLYQYTTDVISSITLSCQRFGTYLSDVNDVISKLFPISIRYGGGLPRSPESHVPNLDATARLISTARYLPQWDNNVQAVYRSLPDLCMNEQVLESGGGANGWSSILLLYGSPEAPFAGRSDKRIIEVNKMARKLREGDPDTVEMPPELLKHSDYVRSILHRRKGVLPM